MIWEFDLQKRLTTGTRTFDLDVKFASNARQLIVTGPSGSGKSMLLKLVAGVETPDSGHCNVDRTGIGLVFQNYALFPHLNVRQNVMFGLARGLRNPPRTGNNSLVDEWLDRLRIRDVAHQYPAELSGGEQQRVALARALAVRPKILLLDEPFAALDGELREAVRAEVERYLRESSSVMMMVSHDPDDVAVFGGDLVRMSEGHTWRGELTK